jgi:hypothetical protein
MPADQLAVLGEGYVAFQHARAHAGRSLIGFLGMFGKLERRAAVSDREIGAPERSLALPQRVLERTILHLLDQVEWARSELNLPGGVRERRASEAGNERRQNNGFEMHHDLGGKIV